MRLKILFYCFVAAICNIQEWKKHSAWVVGWRYPYTDYYIKHTPSVRVGRCVTVGAVAVGSDEGEGAGRAVVAKPSVGGVVCSLRGKGCSKETT